MRKFRILVVDDDPDVCLSLADVLSDFGHTVWTASSATEALISVRERMPEVAIIDGLFGEGVALVGQLRIAGVGVLVAASANPELMEAMRLAGCAHILLKASSGKEVGRLLSELDAIPPPAAVAA